MTIPDFIPKIAFTGGALDHAEDRRDQPQLKTWLKDKNARTLLFLDGKPSVTGNGRLNTVHPDDVIGTNILSPGLVFLGLDDKERPVFAFLLADDQKLAAPHSFQEMRFIAGRMDMRGLALAGRAKSLFDWHGSHRFCSACGKESMTAGGGMYRHCNACQTDHFPRVNPVVIMLVLHDDHVLMGRSAGWPDKAYSALAGFVSPGESLEEACIRETHEETGVHVRNVKYVFSQPWPFPSQLMMGVMCDAQNRDLKINKKEIEDAQWFSRETVAGVFAKSDDTFLRPPGFTIANLLLRYWLAKK